MIASENELTPDARKHLYIFRKCLPMHVRLHEILRFLGRTDGQTCLDIGADNGMVSYQLRRRGGNWYTAVTDQSAADSVRAIVGNNVSVLEDQTLPFKKKIFDAVVIVNFLEHTRSDISFIKECHRILKPDGRLIVSVSRLKTWTLLRPLRALLGLTHEKKGLVRSGYSESQLFSVLKNGFDVYHMRSYSRFFVELTDMVVHAIEVRVMTEKEKDAEKIRRIYSIANVFYHLASQLDMLLFLTKGHYLIAMAKRRAWRPRKAPVLVDGRSISEAVLSRAVN